MTTIIVGKRIAITGLEDGEIKAWLRLSRQANPVKAKLERLKKWAGNVDDWISLGYARPTKDGQMLVLPRGMLQAVWDTWKDDEGATLDVRVSTADTRISDVGTPVDLRDYQAKAIEPWCPETWALPGLPVDGIIHAPTGSGKTYMGIGLFQRLKTRTLVIVHTKDLQSQWAENFEKFGVATNLIGGDGKGVRIVGDEPVTVGMVKSLANRPEELDANQSAFGLCLVDESHHAVAAQHVDVIERLRCGARVGLTATPEREDGLSPSLHMIMGPVRSTVTGDDLDQAGVRVAFTVEMVRTGWAPTEDPSDGFAAATAEMVIDLARNDMVCNAVQSKVDDGHTVLCLTSRVEHAIALAEALDCPAIHGKTKAAERARIFDAMRSGELKCATATQLADEGLDVPTISCVVMATPAKHKGRTMQRIGRALRPVDGKPRPVCVDFLDRHGIYENQCRSRLAAYRKAGMIGGVTWVT